MTINKNPVEITEDNIKAQLSLKLASIPKESGIYVITHIHTKKCYVGSSKQIYRRMTQHITTLYNRKHHNYKLQNLFNSHGLGGFTFTILELCTEAELITREQHYIDAIPAKLRLNVNKRADGSDYLKRNKKRNDNTTRKPKAKRKTRNTNKRVTSKVG